MKILLLIASLALAEEYPGQRLFLNAGCQTCHAIGGVGGNAGPDLTFVGFRRSRDWMDLWIGDPRKWKRETMMPNFQLREKVRGAIADYLSLQKGQGFTDRRPWQDEKDPVAKGRVLFDRAGCIACHGKAGVGGFHNNNVVGELIPAVNKVSQTFTPEELKQKIKRGVAHPEKADPAGAAPMVSMPAWGEVLKDDEIEAVSAYLFSLGGPAKASEW